MELTGLRRLANQGVDPAGFDTPEQVVAWMGAMQAQDYGQALWAIGARLKHGTVADVERAIEEGRILRTWPMRGTLHFVPASWARPLVAASAPRTLAASRRMREHLGLDEAVLARSKGVFAEALAGGKRVTRPALLERLREAGISTEGQRGYHMLVHAALMELICVGPMEGKQQTFMLLPEGEAWDREEALAQLARAYFRSHAPATAKDFAWWAGIPLTEARRLAVEAPADRGVPKSRVHLLPGFDEFLLGYQDRSAVLDPAHANRVVPGGNGMFKAIVVADGKVVGTWRKSPKIQVELFEPLDLDLEAARARYAKFFTTTTSANVST